MIVLIVLASEVLMWLLGVIFHALCMTNADTRACSP